MIQIVLIFREQGRKLLILNRNTCSSTEGLSTFVPPPRRDRKSCSPEASVRHGDWRQSCFPGSLYRSIDCTVQLLVLVLSRLILLLVRGGGF
jgi:hypothetical protein